MEIEEKNENEVLTNKNIDENEPSDCNKAINKYLTFPTMTKEKILRVVLLSMGTAFMLINFFTGIGYSTYNPYCLEDMTHNVTFFINDFFCERPMFNLVLKFIFSLIIDILIVYTLIVWSIYSTNIRLLTTGISYMVLNIAVRFIHIQIRPEKAAFTMNHLFSIFVNYQITTYSFYTVFPGILIICAFEWKRNNNNTMFWIIITVFLCESFIILAMQGNYFHEIFSGGFTGHYFFLMNEKVLTLIYGKEYLGEDIDKGKISSIFERITETTEKDDKNEEIRESKDLEDNITNENES